MAELLNMTEKQIANLTTNNAKKNYLKSLQIFLSYNKINYKRGSFD